MIAKRLQLLVVTLALSISSLLLNSTTYAQTAEPASLLGQDSVRVLAGNWQTLSPGTEHWYRFDYVGENLPIRISLDANSAESAGFQLWTATQFSRLAANPDATPVASSAPDPDDPTHIVWEGALTDPGVYYLVIQPTTETDTEYLLNIGGRGLAPATDGGAIVAGALNVNVRSGPSTAFPVMHTIPQGTELTVLGQDASSTWLSVRLANGAEGWIARFLTDFTGTAITVATPPLAQPPLAPPPTAPPNANTVVPTTPNVNVRSGPSTAYPVLRTVPIGAQVTVLGQDASNAWLSVRLADGAEGWISRSLTDFVGTAPVVATPVLTQPPLAPPATVSTAPGASSLPSQAASLDNFPIEQSLDNNPRILSGGQTQWFTFSHLGDEQPVQIWMDVEPNGAAEFRVFREEDAQAIMAGANPDDFNEIGAGTPNPNEPAALFWRGSFDEHGRYFVMVRSGSTGDVTYSIYGVGPSIGGIDR
jgi:uncharacterized protein YraI